MQTDLFYEMRKTLSVKATPQRAGIWIIEPLTRAMEGEFTWVHFGTITKERRRTSQSPTEPTALPRGDSAGWK